MIAGIALALFAQAGATSTTGWQLRLDASQLYAADDVTDRRVSFTELRTMLDTKSLFGLPRFELHLDARGRKTWTETIAGAVEITRAYLRYGGDLRVAVGRMTLPSVAGARVDGGQIALAVDPRCEVGVFGGASPHPFTGAFDRRFLIFGSGYEWKSAGANHAGGGAVQLFEGGLDRVYLTERAYFSLSPELMIFGLGIVDFLPKPDPTNANVTLRWRPTAMFDVSVGVTHFHAIVPNRWWRDWLEAERERRGFAVESEAPLGARRTSARIVTNLHATRSFTPYAVGRYDRRHDDPADGYEATLGLKYDAGELGYADVAVTERRHFEADSRLAGLSFSFQLAELVTLDAQGTAMQTTLRATESTLMLYDVGGGLWLDLRTMLDGLRVFGQYQAFIDPELTYHVFFARLSYDLGR